MVAPGREASLRLLLDTMNGRPGMADPENALLPFAFFERLHFARFALLDDATTADLEAFGLPRSKVPPLYLAFVGECDGPAQEQFEEFVEKAGSGLRRSLGRLNAAAAGWMEVPATAPVREQAMRLLRVHPLRAADALQLAAALVAAGFQPDGLPFVTLDSRQADAAEREGFTVLKG